MLPLVAPDPHAPVPPLGLPLQAGAWENVLSAILAVALIGYLVYALVRPERF